MWYLCLRLGLGGWVVWCFWVWFGVCVLGVGFWVEFGFVCFVVLLVVVWFGGLWCGWVLFVLICFVGGVCLCFVWVGGVGWYFGFVDLEFVLLRGCVVLGFFGCGYLFDYGWCGLVVCGWGWGYSGLKLFV